MTSGHDDGIGDEGNLGHYHYHPFILEATYSKYGAIHYILSSNSKVLDTVSWTKALANRCLRKYLEASNCSKDLLESSKLYKKIISQQE